MRRSCDGPRWWRGNAPTSTQSRGVIRIARGKGGKERQALVSARLLAILRAYWLVARPTLWLFPGRDAHRPLSPKTLGMACHLACEAAGGPG